MDNFVLWEKECYEMLENSYSNPIIPQIKFFIKNRRIIKKDLAFWPNALIVYALLVINSDNSIEKVKEFNEMWKKNKYYISNFDDYLMAYLLLKNENILEKNDRKKLNKELKTFLNKNDFMIYPYRLDTPDKIYIDLLGMLPPYLAYEYTQTGDIVFIKKAIDQFLKFKEYGFDEQFNLPYHGYDLKSNSKEGLLAWGRGVGWYLFGLSEMISTVNEVYDKKEELIKIYLDTFLNVMKYLNSDGSLSWQILGKESKKDSSATSLILLSFLNLAKNQIIDYRNYNEEILKMISFLKSCINNGKVINCSSECGGFGVYPQNYGCYPWSLAPTIICLIYFNQITGEHNE